jgi:hypothetical protein
MGLAIAGLSGLTAIFTSSNYSNITQISKYLDVICLTLHIVLYNVYIIGYLFYDIILVLLILAGHPC